MKALWLSEHTVRLRDAVRLSPLAPGEARVRVLKAGICGTDLALQDGIYPFEGIPGHEFVGVVEEGCDELLGRRVVGEINVTCGRCEQCRAGLEKHCTARTAVGIRGRHGAFAEFLDLPVKNLHPVPEGVSCDAAVFTEPLAAAVDVIHRATPAPGQRVLVVGAGRLGQLICRVLALHDAEVVALGRHPRKLSRLEGIVTPVATADQIQPQSFELAVECTGSRSGLPIALRALKPRGTLVMKSTYPGPVTLDASSLVVDELHLLGSRCGPFDEALELLQQRRVEVESLIDARYPLERGAEAFDFSREPGVLKVLLETDPAA